MHFLNSLRRRGSGNHFDRLGIALDRRQQRGQRVGIKVEAARVALAVVDAGRSLGPFR